MRRSALRDFRLEPRRLAVMASLGLVIGGLGGLVAWSLVRLIGLITHLAYDGRIGWSLAAPNPAHWGGWSIVVPIVGGILVGLMAKFGSDKIRGHGIPEAIQEILENQSRMAPRVAVLKPLASAVTIGTGGPFGAEGPIIMTGGAVGSIIGQFVPLSATERRTALVAGAAAGMSAIFGAPMAAVLLAVELLLFEWRLQSLLPVVLASTAADVVRRVLLGTRPVFLTPAHSAIFHGSDLFWALMVGLAAGGFGAILSKLVYWTEDWYRRLPVHWMWWPAIGGIVVGIGGLVDPRALGVGYPTIRLLDSGHLLLDAALLLLVVKSVIWVVSLSSGTSGGVLAPLMLVGGALGTVLSLFIPGHATALWATLGMAAMLGGAMQTPLMAVVFTVETTHDWSLLPPLLVASVAATVVTALWIPHSILTEKIARRGVHVPRDLGVHPLELESVAMIMKPIREVVPAGAGEASGRLSWEMGDWLPVLNGEGIPVGAVAAPERDGTGADVRPVGVVYAWERVRGVVEALASSDVAALAVYDAEDHWVGWVTQRDVLKTWRRALAEEGAVAQEFKPPRAPIIHVSDPTKAPDG